MKTKTTLIIDGPILPGSISTAKSKCGKSACACQDEEANRHGVYYRWTGTINGKRTTKTISKEMAEVCKQRIQNYRKLEQQLKKLMDEALENAPWND